MGSKQQKARAAFDAYDAAVIENLFRGGPEPVESEFGYRQGWVVVEGESFNREMAFPEIKFPRFPADQGLND